MTWPLPVTADNMRSWDRVKPEKRLGPRPERLPKPQVSRTVRGVMPARNMPTQRHLHDRCYQRRLSANLTVFRLGFSGGGQNRPVRLVGVLGRLILQGDSKTWFVGFESKSQTALWLRLSHHSIAILPAGAESLLIWKCWLPI